ncbi:MAG: PQQ-binding-like beta-propeller repeat protein [Parvularculales bacterium]
MLRIHAFLIPIVALGACSAPSGPILEGERLPVLVFERQLEADPGLAAESITLPSASVNKAWPQAGGNASHTMYHLAAASTLTELWSVDIGTGSSSRGFLTAPPIVANGHVYTLDAGTEVRAYDAESGYLLWSRTLAPEGEDEREGFGGAVAYEDGRLFVTTGFGQLIALDSGTGEVLWMYEGGIPYRSAPTVEDGRVFAISYDNDLNAFSAVDGRVLWSYQGIPENAGILRATSPAVSESVVVAPFSSGEIVAMRVETGAVVWEESLTLTQAGSDLESLNDVSGDVVIDKDRVIAISHAGRMVAVNLRTGQPIWTRDIGGIQTPWVVGDYIYVVTTDAQLICLSRDNGRIFWVTQLQTHEDSEDLEDPIEWAGPVLAGDTLLAVSSAGKSVLVSPYTGEVFREFSIEDAAYIAPIVANEMIYILTDDATLAAWR